MQTTVKTVQTTAGLHTVTLTGPVGESTVNVPWVIDATGRDTGVMSEQKRTLDPSPSQSILNVNRAFVSGVEGSVAVKV